jgi:hypothetical protein
MTKFALSMAQLALLLHICQFLGSNLEPWISYPNWYFSWHTWFPPGKYLDNRYPKISHNFLFPHTFQSIIHHHPTLRHNVTYTRSLHNLTIYQDTLSYLNFVICRFFLDIQYLRSLVRGARRSRGRRPAPHDNPHPILLFPTHNNAVTHRHYKANTRAFLCQRLLQLIITLTHNYSPG